MALPAYPRVGTEFDSWPEAGVVDEPYLSPTMPTRLHRMDTVRAYVGWRACTATPRCGLS
jgi:hypothetical protein